MDVVEVEWIDAQSSMDTILINDLKKEKVLTTKSCGYLVYGDKEKIILSFMNFGDEFTKHFQIIPRGMVKRIRTFKQ